MLEYIDDLANTVDSIPWEDLSTEEQLNTCITLVKKFCRAQFDPKDDELPWGFALVKRHPETGEQLDKYMLAALAFDPAFLNSSEQKDKLLNKIKDFTKKTDASLMIFTTRAWAVTVEKYEEKPESISKHPRRREIKMIIVDHVSLNSSILVAPITKNESEEPCLGEFEVIPNGGEGRMLGNFFDRKSN